MAIKKMFKPRESRNDPRFSKAQFLTSSRFSEREKDVLSILLDEGQTYTPEEAEQQIQQFMTRRVK
ncbi:hypothetical protein DFP94_101168 [Fontibacillus phaseoli]|uniref:Uncharacterized protein n=1 Tax=Fontibacillus phaseoli TaxID=1416533 RepID=A0A369BPM7_9BACL|nr:hypothetical protein [Fontibacillus phaseoli]RCX22588.1 hypothetical protein DFP94_101168 [Fontibacillus phaseoli]